MYSYIKKEIVDLPNHLMIAEDFEFIPHKKIKGKRISDPDSFDLLTPATGPLNLH